MTGRNNRLPVGLLAGRSVKRALILLLLLLAAPLCLLPAQEESLAERISDLQDHSGEEDFFELLHSSYSSVTDPESALEIMHRFLPVLDAEADRHRLLLDMADLEEQLGLIDKAQIHYQSAAFTTGQRRDYHALYKSVLLLIDLGDYEQALLQARQVSAGSEEGALSVKARLQHARIYQLQNRNAAALEIADEIFQQKGSFSADALYLMWSVYANSNLSGGGDSEKAESLVKELKARFPDSPEYKLASGKIRSTPTVESAFGLRSPTDVGEPFEEPEAEGEQPPQGDTNTSPQVPEEKSEEDGPEAKSRAIQTGSFQDADNAAYMQRELEKLGFNAMVVQADVNGKRYYKVLVPIAFGESEQEIVLKLKEKGFEGYPVY